MPKLCCQCGEREVVRECRCRECANAYHREWRKQNLGKMREYERKKQARYYADSTYRNGLLAKRRRQRQSLRENGGSKYEAVLRGERVDSRKRLYGVDEGRYKKMLKAQGSACAICRRSRPLEVDHNHQKGHDGVRGLLCGRCNSALGLFKDSIELLESALRYLDAERQIINSTARPAGA